LQRSDPSRTFKAIADSTRRDIIRLLADEREGLNISQLTMRFDSTRQAVTKHIKQLEDAGLVRVETRGRERTCHADLLKLKAVYDWVRIYEQYWTEKLDSLGQFLDATSAQEPHASDRHTS
jgi:DNA-binding transcriptional ArsR family regulator